MAKIKLNTVLIFALVVFATIANAQKNNNSAGFVYTGEVFNDPDWGWSYKTSEQDRTQLSRANDLIKLAVKQLLASPGDYTTSVSDMSFAFDPKEQEKSKANGSKCVTCYYSYNPNGGLHFQYRFDVKLELEENSKSYLKKMAIDDSIFMLTQKIIANKKKSGNTEDNEKKIKEEMEKYQKEIESMDMSKLTESQIAEIERKSKKISEMGNANEKTQKISDDTLHAMYENSHAVKSNVTITTNDPILAADKAKYLALRNNPNYYFQEVRIPGCDFAFIYFDRYNKSEFLPFSQNPVLVAYAGTIYANKAALPKAWVKPYCVQLTYSGNMQQINEIISKIDFASLRSIAH